VLYAPLTTDPKAGGKSTFRGLIGTLDPALVGESQSLEVRRRCAGTRNAEWPVRGTCAPSELFTRGCSAKYPPQEYAWAGAGPWRQPVPHLGSPYCFFRDRQLTDRTTTEYPEGGLTFAEIRQHHCHPETTHSY